MSFDYGLFLMVTEGMWVVLYIAGPLLSVAWKNVKPHLNKIPSLFLFGITLVIGGIITYIVLENVTYIFLWPHTMTLLTLLSGWQSYTLYKETHPNPTNYQIDMFEEAAK